MNTKRTVCLLASFLILAGTAFAGGSGETTVKTDIPGSGVPIRIVVTEGEHFLHRLRVMPLISVKNPPQMAAWAETPDGEFLATLFITGRIARQEWRGAPGDPTPTEEIRRKEALPVWAHRHGRVYADGLRVPTRQNPMPDSITAATPKAGFDLRTAIPGSSDPVVIYFEVNASADFNNAYPADAEPGAANYSGGEWGSGQPSLVYAATIDPDSGAARISMEPVGHGSPDGSDGRLRGDLSGLTTARHIVRSVEVVVPATGDASAAR
jgi:hypothetical protein